MLDARAELACNDYEFLRRRPLHSTGSGRAIRIADLFAGCGGLTLGAVQASAALGRPAHVALAAEIDPTVRAVYRANFPLAAVDTRGDVTKLFDGDVSRGVTPLERRTRERVGNLDLLIGGPPCQGHSNLNNHTRWNDSRNTLYLRMVRAAEVLEPTSIAIENVPGVSRDRWHVVEVTVARLEQLGYCVDQGIVDIASLGVPQLRYRHILIASSRRAPSVDRLIGTHLRPIRSLKWAIGDLEEIRVKHAFDTSAEMSRDNRVRARWLIAHDAHDLPNYLRPACHRNKPDHKYKSMYGRLSWEQPAQTITTGFGSPGQGRYLHPSSPRTLTPHEAARIQFFPDWFSFDEAKTRTALAHCIGNAVPPKLGYAIARYLVALALRRTLPIQPEGSAMSESTLVPTAAE